MISPKTRWLCAFGLFGGLAGCGGGNSDTTTDQFPLDAAISALAATNQNYGLEATDNNGNIYGVQLIYTVGAEQSFEGTAALTTLRGFALFENDNPVSADSKLKFYLTSPYTQIGDVDQVNGQYTVYAHQTPLPTLASVGDSGNFDTATLYSDSTLETVVGTEVDTWNLNAGGGDQAKLCLNYTVTPTGGTASTETDCYTVDIDGNTLGLSIQLTINGSLLTFD